jgi:hypothetical protein
VIVTDARIGILSKLWWGGLHVWLGIYDPLVWDGFL